MGRTACTEPQCLYKGALYLFLLLAASCLSVRVEKLGFHWTDFHEILYLRIFRESVAKIQVSLKSDKNNSGTSHVDRYTLSIIVNKKVQLDATVCRRLFTAKSLYMFRVSQHPSSGALKTVTAASGIGHNTGTATSFHRGLIRTGVSE